MSKAKLLLKLGKQDSWSPYLLTPSVLKEWWSADDLTNGAVTTWTGRINGTAPTQATGSLQPVKSMNYPGGYAGVLFDGVDDCLRTTTFPALPVSSSTGSLWSLFYPTSLAAVGTAISYGNGVGTLRRTLISSGGRVQSSDASITVNSTTIFTANSHIASRSVFDSTSISTQANGDTLNTTGGATLNTGTVRLALGSSNSGAAAQFLTGYIRHVFVLQNILSSDDANRLVAWLLWDVGQQALLPSTNPYRDKRP